MNRVEFHPAARAELDAAAEHYERGYSGRGLRFYSAVERATRAAVATPAAGPPYPRVSKALAVRARRVPGFPFTLAYQLRGDLLLIVAVAHHRRRPGYWTTRL